MTNAQSKAEKRQVLLNNVIESAIDFELVKLNDKIGNEVVISKNISHGKTGITLENIKTGERKEIKALQTIIENQPITYIVIDQKWSIIKYLI